MHFWILLILLEQLAIAWNPKQIPKVGLFIVLVYWATLTFASNPLIPKPGKIKTPSYLSILLEILSSLISSALIKSYFSSTSLCAAAIFNEVIIDK
ncbi:hypothetical protein NWP96_05060 [Mycoplasmopsis cynos]|nr:hypothetical protein [Mycoplasmopsis cynos]